MTIIISRLQKKNKKTNKKKKNIQDPEVCLLFKIARSYLQDVRIRIEDGDEIHPALRK